MVAIRRKHVQFPINARSQSEVRRRRSRKQRARFVRRTFDWAGCSEPLARLRRTRAYGYSIVSWRSMRGGNSELGPKWAVAVVATGIIFGRMRMCEVE